MKRVCVPKGVLPRNQVLQVRRVVDSKTEPCSRDGAAGVSTPSPRARQTPDVLLSHATPAMRLTLFDRSKGKMPVY